MSKENYPKCKRMDCVLQAKNIMTNQKTGKCAALSQVYSNDAPCPFYKRHLKDVNRLPVDKKENLHLEKQKSEDAFESNIPREDADLLRTYMTWTANLFPNDWKTVNRFFRTAVKAMGERDDMAEKLKEMKAEKEKYCLHLPEDTPTNYMDVLLYLNNGGVAIGYYLGTDEDGGCYYSDGDEIPLIEHGLIVTGWRRIPKEGN